MKLRSFTTMPRAPAPKVSSIQGRLPQSAGDFTPEGLSALRAVAANQLQRAVNLCLGAAASTLGLTVPAVLMIGLLTGQTVVLGLSATNMVLLVTTLILSALTFSGPRTTMLEGAVHLTLFGVFFVLIFSP